MVIAAQALIFTCYYVLASHRRGISRDSDMSRTLTASIVRTTLATATRPSKSAARIALVPAASRRNDVKRPCNTVFVSTRSYTSPSSHAEPRFEHPALNQLKEDLTVLQPCFGVRGDEIDVLFEPADFHQRLLVSRKARSDTFEALRSLTGRPVLLVHSH
jgi:hypothetical protein